MPVYDHTASAAPVVVGVDGSPNSLRAVDLAVREAVLHRRALHLVHAYIWPGSHLPPTPVGPPEGLPRRQAQDILEEARRRAHAAAPDLPISAEAITGEATAVLRAYSRTARLLVVGDRGRGGFAELLLGSVATQLAAHTSCPVLIARGSSDPAAPVLLGVDGSPANESAVRFAFEEADLRGTGLLAIHAWTHPVSTGPGDMLPPVYDVAATEAEEERLLSEALAGWRGSHPDVLVDRRLVRGGARKTLIEATRDAQLAVVGSRGWGGFTGMLLGSVSQAVLHHAECPVALIPQADIPR